ncbi:MAG: hypothetical protein R3251_03150 [Candidatus Spechtbacterales bacterium]|nr:hypothetical protein [Candidatus Spechtbacterales bacterium]
MSEAQEYQDVDIEELIASVVEDVVQKTIKEEVERLQEEGHATYEIAQLFFQRGKRAVLKELGLLNTEEQNADTEYEPFDDGRGETGHYL